MYTKGDLVKTPEGKELIVEASNPLLTQLREWESFKYYKTDTLELVRSWEDYKKESLEKGNSIKQFRERAKEMHNKIIRNPTTSYNENVKWVFWMIDNPEDFTW